ncbi:MAG: peptidoglycan-binding protein [Candidatus Pacebacteria bacterium]|nr:peptidoglycan-binding protein [Candidatus Paceibacterota bacterium]
MENLKFTITSVIMVMVIGAVGFLAYMALERGDESGLKQQVRELKAEIAAKDEMLVERDRQIAQLTVDVEGQQVVSSTVEFEPAPVVPTKPTTTTTTTSSGANSELLSALQSLKSKNIILEPGDSGAAVGTIQKFLNVYNKTSGGVDNDFGPGTRTKVEAFQSKEGLTPDGGVGPGTLSKMISWLQAQ